MKHQRTWMGVAAAVAVLACCPEPGRGAVLTLTPGVDYSKPNWAYTGPITKFTNALPGLITAATGARSASPYTALGTNEIGQGIPLAIANTPYGSPWGATNDYYEIGLVEFIERMHTNLPATGTKLRGYVQIVPSGFSGAVPLTTANGLATNVYFHGVQQYGATKPHYLGPLILATKNRPVRVKFYNLLPTGEAGKLFIPTDTETIMGAGAGWKPASTNNGVTVYEKYTENRAAIHLHGGLPPWISDGTAHQWTAPAGETTSYKRGAGEKGVPDMIPGANLESGVDEDGVITFYWPNQMSGRLMFYHDHAWGLTGVNVYAGEAAGYLVVDPVEEAALATAGVPGTIVTDASSGAITSADLGHLIPLVIQDKTFVPPSITNINATATADLGQDGTAGQVVGFTVVNAGSGYPVAPAVTITDPNGSGATATATVDANGSVTGITPSSMGSGYTAPVVHIDSSPGIGVYNVDPNWVTDIKDWMTGLSPGEGNLWYPHIYIPNQWPDNPDDSGANPYGRWDWGPWFWPPWPVVAGVTPPKVSHTPEAFMDTMMVNGQPYPYLDVNPTTYRLRILNACNDRMLNLQLYKASAGIVTNIVVTAGGTGYDPENPPYVFIKGPGGRGARATAEVSEAGAVTAVNVTVGGNGYSSAPVVTIDPSPSGGTQATATAQIYTAPTEIGMVVASPQAGISFPLAWRAQTIPYPADILDGRLGGVPDPANRGPAMVQIGTEGGLLPNPVVLYNTPVGYEENKNNIIVLNVKEKTLFLAPAERADVVVDFSKFAGQTVILYNDSTAPVPAGDIRWDLYTGNPDNTGSGGAPSTLAGMGPNTRTIMAFRVSGTKGTTVPDHYPTNLVANLTTNLPALFKTEQPAPVVPAAAYNTIGYSGGQPTNKFSRIQDNSLTFTPYGSTFPVTMYMQPKCIQELFDDVGRLNATLGTEVPLTTGMNQTTIPLNFVDPATEVFTDGETQIWKITHNGVDTHGIHFHLFDVQVVNRVGWDGQIYPPDPNELGWKDTVRMDPLTDTIVAMRAVKPDLSGVAWGGAVPTSERLLNPALPTNSVLGFSNLDPLTGNQFAPAIQNVWTNFGWEYTWHCHILGHEENDMMRPVVLNVPLNPPTAPSGLAANYVPNSGTPALSRVDLTWVDNAPTEIGFKIVRSITSDFTGTLVTNVLPVNSTSFSDTTVGNATATYYYRVYAFNSAGSSTLPSNTAKVVIAFGPTAPTGLTATPSVLSTLAPTIALAWTDNAINEANFVVQRDTNPGFTAPTTYLLPANTAVVPATVGAMTYTQTSAMGIAEATTYYYRVRATNSVGPSAWTSIVTATTPGRLPIAPSNVRSGGATRTTILMRWNDNANNETGFNVYRGPTSAGPWTLAATVGANTTSYTLAGLTRATTYYARVIAFNANGQSTAATSTAMPTSP